MKLFLVTFCVALCSLSTNAKKVRFNSEFFVQLSNATFEILAQAPYEILVVDPDDVRLTAEENEMLKRQGKTVLAYLSTGQAESFRSYWTDEWTLNSSSIFVKPDVKYQNGMIVEYWRPEWKDILLGYLANNVFPYNYSGLLMDYLQTYDQFTGVRQKAAEEMVNLAQSIAEAARKINPRAVIIAQDSISLWDLSDSFKAMVDGVSVEQVWYDIIKGMPRSSSWTLSKLDVLRRISQAKKLVMLEEYVEKNSQICAFYKKCVLEGFLCGVFDGALTGIQRDCMM